MKLNDMNFVKILPHWMRGDEFDTALAEAFNEVFGVPFKRVKVQRVWDQIDNMNNEELDELAWEMNIEWWESGWDIEVKRANIKDARKIIEKKGTKYSVEMILDKVFGTGEVHEWFEYSGDPFHFRVVANSEQVTEEQLEKFRKLIGITMPARSVLDEIEIITPVKSSTYLGALSTSYCKNVIIAEV